jgi:hypothetical protein
MWRPCEVVFSPVIVAGHSSAHSSSPGDVEVSTLTGEVDALAVGVDALAFGVDVLTGEGMVGVETRGDVVDGKVRKVEGFLARFDERAGRAGFADGDFLGVFVPEVDLDGLTSLTTGAGNM